MSNQPQPSAASIVAQDKRRSRTRRRRWFIAGGVVAGLLLFGFVGLPPIIRSQAIKHLSAALHREVAIEKIRLNPLTLSVTIEGLDIKDRDGGAFTKWKRLYVNFDSFSLFTGEWRFQEIALDGFGQRVVVGKDGAFNFADLIPPPAEKPAQTEPAKPMRPIRIEKLAVTSAALSFADDSRAKPFKTEVGPLSFTLDKFVTAGNPKAPYAFTAVTEAGESFSWKGTVAVDPVRSAGEFAIGKLNLAKYAPYYAHMANADLLDGLLDVNASYSINLAEGERELKLNSATIKLSKLKVAARGSSTPLVDLPSFIIEGLHADGLTTSATIHRIALEGGHISVVREKDGSINLLNLLPQAPAQAAAAPAVALPSATPAPAVASALPDVKLTEFAISGLAVDFEDLATPTPAKNGLSRIDLSVQNIALAQASAPVLVKLALEGSTGGKVAVEGSAVREPLTADLAVKVAAFPLAGATPYIEPMLNINISGGAVSVDARARLAGTVASFAGDVVVDKFATVDGGKAEEFAGFTQLAIRGIDAVSEPLTARIGEITLVDPSARVAVYADKTTNLATILRTPPAAPEGEEKLAAPAEAPAAPAPAPAPAAGPAPVWSLGKFTLTNGSATVVDRSVKPAARISLNNFSGTVTGLSSTDLQRADVDIRGQLNGTGSIAFTGKLDAKATTPAPGARTEIVVDVKGVDLSPISPYVGTYAGYELARSGLTVDVKANLSQRKLDTSNVVTLNQFTFGPPTNSPEATKLPVRLGVALLKDIDGNIVIDLPVKGDLDDPSFKIGRVVLRVIVNLLVKAATSPFSLIGAAFGGGGDELAYQNFASGAQTPLEAELPKIDTLRKALKGRPALNLDITGSFDPEADLAAVRDQILTRQVRYRLWEELRAKNPETPPPAEIALTPEDEARIIGLFMAERYPAGVPSAATDGSLPPPAPLYAPVTTAPAKAPETRVVMRRGRVFDTRASSSVLSKTPEPAKPAVTIALPGAAPAEGSAPGAAPALTLADARRALASGIPVPPEDLLKLADDRAKGVRDALLAGGEISAERLFLTPPSPDGKGSRVFLQLR